MEKLKKYIRKFGGENIQNIIIFLLRITNLRNKIILFSTIPAKNKRVNINYWSGEKNLGDAISPIVVEYVASQKGIDIHKEVDETKHLYAIGSVITAGCQDCTVWGSGILNTRILSRIRKRKLDIRSVRGPLTRLLLIEHGYSVPENYGDPAILMPMIYNPDVEKKYDFSVVTHMNESLETEEGIYHQINIRTDDYEGFIRQIKESKKIISSSLHGIILAEAYGVPAVLLKPKMDLFKYYDYYYSTNRYNFPIANSVKEAIEIEALDVPDYTDMRNSILASFPIDLWN